MRGMLRSLHHEIAPTGAAHREVEFACRLQHRVAQHLGLEFPALLPPQPGVAGVDAARGRVVRGGLPVGRAEDDLSMEALQGAAVVAEIAGQPIEQFRVARRGAVPAKVVGRLDKTAAEVVLPDAVDHAAPDQRVIRVREPTGQGRPPLPFRRAGRQREARRREIEGRDRSRTDLAHRLRDLPAGEQEDRAGLAALGARAHERPAAPVDTAGIDERRLRQAGQLGRDLRGLGPDRAQLGDRAGGHRRSQQGVAFGAELRHLVRGRTDRREAVGEVGRPPPRRGLDRVQGAHRTTLGDVPAIRGADLELRQRQDEVTLARGQFDRRHADIATGDAVLRVDLGHVRRQPGVREVRHVGLVVTAPDQLDPLAEFRVVAHLDLEAHGETEAGADVIEIIVARREDHLGQLDPPTEVDLHPLGRVGARRDPGMITEIRRRVARLGRRRPRHPLEPLGQGRVGRAGRGDGRTLEPGAPRGELRLPAAQGFRPRVRGVVEVIRPVRAIEGGEHRLEAIIILLTHRVELVRVALRALDGETGESPERVRHHVITIEVPGDLPVDLRLGDLRMADEIPRAGGEETQRLDAVARPREERVPRHLLLDETGVGLVRVEGPDDVVAVGPRMIPRLVLVVAVRVPVVRDVEPMPGPALAMAGRRQQAVDQPLIGRRRGVGDEGGDLLGGRRQARQVERDAADQGGGAGHRRRLQALLGEFRAHEMIDRRRALRGNFGPPERTPRPPVPLIRHGDVARGGPDRAFGDPGAQGGLLGRRQQSPFRRHPHLRLRPRDETQQRAFLGPARHDIRRMRLASVQGDLAGIKPIPTLLLLRPVAFQAVGLQDRSDLPGEIHRGGSDRGQPRQREPERGTQAGG